MKAYLNIEELADCLNISKSQIYCMTSQRRIPFIKAGRRVLFDPEQIEKWMDSHRVEAREVQA